MIVFTTILNFIFTLALWVACMGTNTVSSGTTWAVTCMCALNLITLVNYRTRQ